MVEILLVGTLLLIVIEGKPDCSEYTDRDQCLMNCNCSFCLTEEFCVLVPNLTVCPYGWEAANESKYCEGLLSIDTFLIGFFVSFGSIIAIFIIFVCVVMWYDSYKICCHDDSTEHPTIDRDIEKSDEPMGDSEEFMGDDAVEMNST